MLSSTSVGLPLTGIRVLDLSTIVAGPAAGMILSDLGADVIKVERIGRGEDARSMGPHRGEWGAYFVPLNRGKRSITIDITKLEGRDTVLRLAESCDVFLENFRGGKAAALGLDEAAVRAHKPDVVYASISAYGSHGPDYTKPGYDAVLQARTGIMSVTGNGNGEAMRSGVSILDIGTGVWMALGVLAALLERQKSGKGQRVDTSLFQSGVMLMLYHLVYRQFAGVNPQPQGSRHTAFAPYGAFRAQDGTIMIGVSSDKMFQRLCTAFDHDEWGSDPRFRTNPDRVHNVDVLQEVIEAVMRTKPAVHWVGLLNQHDVASDLVQNPDQVLHDEQLAAIGQLAEVALAGEKPVLLPRLPVAFSSAPASPLRPPPAPGEHGRAILREAGFDDPEIEKLIGCGAVG